MEANAGRAQSGVLRQQPENFDAELKDFRKNSIEGSQETQFPNSVLVDDPTLAKDDKQSEAFVNALARPSASKLPTKSSSSSPSMPPRCSHESQASCFQCLAAREPPKPRPLIVPATKTMSDPLQLSVGSLSSGTSAVSGVEQPERYLDATTVATTVTPPESPAFESETKKLDSFIADRASIPKPVNSTEVEDDELRGRHHGHHSDTGHGDEQHIQVAFNDDGSVKQTEDNFQEIQVPVVQTEGVDGPKRSADLVIQADTRWTKISKDLVDPRVLDDCNEQYKEETHDIVVFRVLTKEEIDHYSFKTQESRRRKTGVLEKAPNSWSSGRDIEYLTPTSKEVPLNLAKDIVEPAGHSESFKQNDRKQIKKNISTGNAARFTENESDAIWSVTGSLKVKKRQFQALKTRNAKTDRGIHQDINSSILSFTIVTIFFLPLSFVSSVFGMNISEIKMIRASQSTTFIRAYKNLLYFIINFALGACVVRILGSISDLYLSNSNWRSHQRWHQILELCTLRGRFAFADSSLLTLIILLGIIYGTELIMFTVARPWVSSDSSARYTPWHAFWCFVACILVYLVIPETGSGTLKEMDRTISATSKRQTLGPDTATTSYIELDHIRELDHTFVLAGETAFSKRKAARMNWIMRETMKILQSFFLGAKENLCFLRREHLTFPSLMKNVAAASPKKERLHSQCRCGYRFYDDFVELRPSAAVEYEESLLRRLSTSRGRPNPVEQIAREQSGGDTRTTKPPNSNRSSYVSNGINGFTNFVKGLTDKESRAPPLPRYQVENRNAVVPGAPSELLYLLMCVPQHQYATKLLQPQISAIRSDQDFFLLLRRNYRQMRGRIRRLLSLKALRSVKFVQLEMYKSELVDIRKQDDLPPEDKKDEYRYNPVPAEIIPPVGENHMLHLINHPTHAEEDGFVLDRIPKKLRERLLVCPSRGTGLGWGIYFIEGWHLSIITIVAFTVLLAGSLAFLVCWSVLKHDVQGASGVAAYIVAFLGLAIGSIQAVFELT